MHKYDDQLSLLFHAINHGGDDDDQTEVAGRAYERTKILRST